MNDELDPIGPDLSEPPREPGDERRSFRSRARRLLTDPRTLAVVVTITAVLSALAIAAGAAALARDLETRRRLDAIERPTERELVARVVLALDACNRAPDCRERLRTIFLSLVG